MALNYDAEKLDALIDDIYNGAVDPLNLPEDLYKAVASHLSDAVNKGLGKMYMSIQMGGPDYALYSQLRSNIYLFSAARTFQQTLEMSEALTDHEGNLRSLKDFKVAAQAVYMKYNGGEVNNEVQPGWIETEYNTAVTQAGNAKKWVEMQSRKDILPYARRVAVEDELECEICGELHGITAPIDSPIWNKIGGASHFNCRCIIEQLDGSEAEGEVWTNKQMEAAVERSGMPDEFKYNPGVKKEVFSSEGESKHPYFMVPKKYMHAAQQNFNLPVLKDEMSSSMSQNMVGGEFTEERKRLHDHIISEIASKAKKSDNVTVYMNGGGPASGKSAVTEGVANRPKGLFSIDPDHIKEQLPEYKVMTAAKNTRAAAFSHEESSYISKKALKEGLKGKYDVLLDGTGDGTYEDLKKKVTNMRELGAKRIVADYVSLDTNLALKLQEIRAAKTGRDVPESVLRETHRNVSMVVPHAIKNNLFDEFRLWDTNINGKPRLVCELKDGDFKMFEPKLWEDFLNKAKH